MGQFFCPGSDLFFSVVDEGERFYPERSFFGWDTPNSSLEMAFLPPFGFQKGMGILGFIHLKKRLNCITGKENKQNLAGNSWFAVHGSPCITWAIAAMTPGSEEGKSPMKYLSKD